jgi:flagellar hook-basal body complex protein FliE
MNPVSPSSLMQLRSTILAQNQALHRAAGSPDATLGAGATPATSFGGALSDALKAVNAQQVDANDTSAAYERGDTNDIVGVMVSRQKASVGFEATLQMRNKLLGAYRDIMNMPV